MTKFEEMRLRAIHFQKMTGCHLCIKWDHSIQLHCAHAEFKDGEFIIDDIDHENPTEEEWIKEVESYGGYGLTARFPSLLEAQGWIAVENALPEPDQWTQIRIVNWNEVNIGTSRYFESSEKGKWFLGVQWKYSNDTCIEVRTEHLRVTHWKPLDIFPEPFEPSNV